MPEARLGYRGILIHNRTTAGPDLVSFIVYRTKVQLTSSRKPAACCVDAVARLETKFLEYAQRQDMIDDSPIALIKQAT